MGKTIILLAGDPATGKSYFCNKIRGQYPQFRVISQDAIKERLWDEYGFDSGRKNGIGDAKLGDVL